MTIVTILSSLNIIGLIAFLITLGFLVYEVILLTNTKKGENAPHVPQFEEGAQPLPPTLQIKEAGLKNLTKNLTKNNKIILAVLALLLIIFGGFTLFSNIKSTPESVKVTTIAPTVGVQVRRAIPTIRLPTEISFTRAPTGESLEAPAEIVRVEPTVTELTELSPTLTPTPSPTVIEELPVTSYMNNSLILFSAAGLFLFFAFLF